MQIAEFVVGVILEQFEPRYIKAKKFEALRLRTDWRKADIRRLRKIGVPEVAETRIERVASEKALGRGVVPQRPEFAGYITEGLKLGFRLFDPATPAQERRKLYKQTRWFPYLVEAAYRGELQKLKGERRGKNPLPHARSCEMAEERVAEAASVSCAVVRKMCHAIRKERGDNPPDEPPTSAVELKDHLENGLKR